MISIPVGGTLEIRKSGIVRDPGYVILNDVIYTSSVWALKQVLYFAAGQWRLPRRLKKRLKKAGWLQ